VTSAPQDGAISVRPERPADVAAVRRVNEEAFGQPAEAAIVDALRRHCPDALSLVATEGDSVVGHIFFSPATVECGQRVIEGMGLAPMAVLPGRQRRGIGTLLARAGIATLRERRCPFVIVLGHPEYYPRFGFVPASRHGLRCQWDGVPDEAFMVLILDEGVMQGVSGVASYRSEFDQAM
jgi:putative acetyltransferase